MFRPRDGNALVGSATAVVVVALMLTAARAGDRATLPNEPGPSRDQTALAPSHRALLATISTTNLTTPLTPADMVEELLGLPIPGITTSNWTFNGAANPSSVGGGIFTGGGTLPTGPIGIDSGVILSSGDIALVMGGPSGSANQSPVTGLNRGDPGDSDLAALPWLRPTFDAAVLEFDIVSETMDRTMGFQFVFASEEYNDWVYTRFDDRCAIFVTGPGILASDKNRARTPFGGGTTVIAGAPISPWFINNGNPFGSPNARNPNHYQNNECGIGGLPSFPCAPPNRETEADGLTKYRFFNVPLVAKGVRLLADQTYHVKIAIADASDRQRDSWLLVKGNFSGACCHDGGQCDDGVSMSFCTAIGGTFTEDTLCEEITSCGTIGACCNAGGTCTPSTTYGACVPGGGVFAGDGTGCGAVGACCFLDGTCGIRTQICCELEAGTFSGNGTTCSSGQCAGACCMGNSCQQLNSTACDTAGGTFLGVGPCLGNTCLTNAGEVPAVSEWGVAAMLLLIFTGGTMVIRRRAAIGA